MQKQFDFDFFRKYKRYSLTKILLPALMMCGVFGGITAYYATSEKISSISSTVSPPLSSVPISDNSAIELMDKILQARPSNTNLEKFKEAFNTLYQRPVSILSVKDKVEGSFLYFDEKVDFTLGESENTMTVRKITGDKVVNGGMINLVERLNSTKDNKMNPLTQSGYIIEKLPDGYRIKNIHTAVMSKSGVKIKDIPKTLEAFNKEFKSPGHVKIIYNSDKTVNIYATGTK